MNVNHQLSVAYDFVIDKCANGKSGIKPNNCHIRHTGEVAGLVIRATERPNLDLVIAAILHDLVECSPVTFSEIAEAFGSRVAELVAEITDDKSLSEPERRRIQIERLAHTSAAAKIIRLADKISNLHSLALNPPWDWKHRRLLEYVDWASEVAAGCSGASQLLDAEFDSAAHAARAAIQKALIEDAFCPDARPWSSDLPDSYFDDVFPKAMARTVEKLKASRVREAARRAKLEEASDDIVLGRNRKV